MATFNGTTGNDPLTGSANDDTLNGSAGCDTLSGGAGNDSLNGGDDFDEVRYDDATGPVTVNLSLGTANGAGAGTDSLINIESVKGSQYADTLIGDAATFNVLQGYGGNDSLSGGAGCDFLVGGEGNDTLDGGAGDDFVFYDADATGPVIVNLILGSASGAGVGTDTLINIENAYGSDHADSLIGDANDNALRGFGGNDSLSGGAGNDDLWGDDGNDDLYGQAGNDVIHGNSGDDGIDGAVGTDMAVFSGQFADYAISYDRIQGTATLTDHRTGGDGTDSLRNIEKLQFSDQTFDMTAQVFGAEAAVATLNRAFANTSPGNATFNSQVASAKAQITSGADSTSMVSYLTYAKSFGAHYIDQTPFALASLLLTNMGLLPSTNATVLDLEPALGYYIQQVGVENVGIIALQLSSIISTFETKGGSFAVYNAPAVAWNNEVAAAYAYASNPANTTSLTDPVIVVPATYTLTANALTIDEGTSVSFVVSTSQVAPGTVLHYTLKGTITAADLAGGAMTGPVNVGADGKATVKVDLAADQFTEGTEILYATFTEFSQESARVSVIDVSLTGQPDGGGGGGDGSGGGSGSH
jgi:Ca2+-binding RTX toxin-like protein